MFQAISIGFGLEYFFVSASIFFKVEMTAARDLYSRYLEGKLLVVVVILLILSICEATFEILMQILSLQLSSAEEAAHRFVQLVTFSSCCLFKAVLHCHRRR